MLHDVSPILLAYVLVGPVAWLLLGLGMVLGRKRMNRLLKSRTPLPASPPRVTVLIPAKDEGPRVRLCVESVLAQDYPDFDVVVINDRSTDDTGPILDQLAAESNGKVRAVHVPHGGLPDGWLGKCHALHVGAKHADGSWLMFIDSDVRLLQPDAISRALALSESRKYDALSILTLLECDTFLERLVLPLAAGAWSIMHTISLTNDDNRPDVAYANGQFFLIRRTAYASVGGHESVRACITEDVEMMRLLKKQAAKTRFLLGGGMASTRMHANLRQMLRGWGRIYSGTTRRRPWRILGAMAFLVISGFSLYAAALWMLLLWSTGQGPAAEPWAWAMAVHLVAMTALLAHVYAESGNPRQNALLFPIGGAVLLSLLAFALKWCITGRIEWRGTTFDQNASTLPTPTGKAAG